MAEMDERHAPMTDPGPVRRGAGDSDAAGALAEPTDTGAAPPVWRWWLLAGLTLLGCALAYLEKLPCRRGGWNVPSFTYAHACYTDIYPLYFTEQLAAGRAPYLHHQVEYPVLIGGVMQLVAWVVSPIASPTVRGAAFYDVTVALMTACALTVVLAMAAMLGRRWKDAIFVALAPGLILAAYVNWDLLACALTVVALALWARRRVGWAGVALGLAVATKFYPLLFLGALLVLCLRAGRMRAFWTAFATAAAAWLVVNVPVLLAAPHGWARFYTFSKQRPADWGSIWYMFETEHVPVLGNHDVGVLNLYGTVLVLVGCAAIAVLALAAPRRPRLAQLCFLLLAVFLLTNKVWSPQYVVWLLPLAVLARPRIVSYGLWQLAEICYFFAIWEYLLWLTSGGQHGIANATYFAALLARALTVVLLGGLVVRDILRPHHDVVREHADDPCGGVLSEASDRFALVRRSLVRKAT